MLPLAAQIRWKPENPPYAVLGLIAFMGLMHFVSWLGMELWAWPISWRWKHWALVYGYPEPTQFLTSILAHGDFFHWFYNCFFLWVFGAPLENRLGWRRFLGAFFLCGIAIGLLKVGLFHLAYMDEEVLPRLPRSLGSSGAISAIMGMAALRFRRAKLVLGLEFLFNLPLLRFSVPLWAFVAWSIGADVHGLFFDDGPTGHFAHLLGYLGGFVFAGIFKVAKDGKDDVLWDQAREDMDMGHWRSAREKMLRVVARRPDDLEALEDLLCSLRHLLPPNPATVSEKKAETIQWYETYVQSALRQGKVGRALAQLRFMAPTITLDDLSDKTRLFLKPYLGSRRHREVKRFGTLLDLKGSLLSEEERIEQRNALMEGIMSAGRAAEHAQAAELARRLALQLDFKDWPLELLVQAYESAKRADDSRWKDYAEWLVRKGSTEQRVAALRSLEKADGGTIRHARLGQLFKEAIQRDPAILEHPDYELLKARVCR